MDWYFMVWRKYAEFNGRSRRTEYWMFVLFHMLVLIVLAAVGGAGLAMSRDNGGILFIPLGLYALAGIVPGLAVAVRRFHDSGKSGWLFLLFIVLGVIPFLGIIAGIIQIVFLCIDSDPGDNKYGPNPKLPVMVPGIIAGNPGFATMGFPAQGFPAQPQPFTGQDAAAFCSRCGARMAGGSSFCGSCGAHV